MPSSQNKPKRKHWLYSRYAEWDKRRVTLPDDALKLVEVSTIVASVPVAKTAPELDILIQIGSGLFVDPIAQSPRYGVWFVHHGDPRRYAGIPPYFWELYDKNPVTATVILALQNDASQLEVIYEAFSSTEQGWSVRQNGSVPYWRASSAILSCLQRLPRQCECAQISESKLPGHLPSNLQMVKFLSANVVRTVSRRIRYSNQELYWFVAYRTDPTRFVANTELFNPSGFCIIEAPPGHFYADPFPLRWNNQTYVFVEDYSDSLQRGCISVLRMDATGKLTSAENVLERPYHLSYPFVFEHDGDVYMIPETLEANCIELYRATHVPERWELTAVLKEGVRAVDTTLWIQDGLFYFFTNIARRGVTVNDDLFLFCADRLLGKWRPHPANPICADVRRGRGAGKLFRRNGKLIRPGQDCSVCYGHACQLNEIEVLSPDDYKERPLNRIEPNWYPGLVGTHTINSDETIEVIDGQINRPKRRASA